MEQNNESQTPQTPQTPPQIQAPKPPMQPTTPPPMYPSPKPKKKSHKTLWIILGVLVFFFIIIVASGGDDNKEAAKSNKPSKDEWRQELVDELNAEKEYIDSVVPMAKNTKSGEMLCGYVSDMEAIADKKLKDSTYTDVLEEQEIVDKINDNKKRASAILPTLKSVCRKQYAKYLDDKLWEHNIDVETSNGGTTITFIGGIFASNKNIKDFQNQSAETLRMFGFKRVIYKWIPHDPNYTYYDLE